MVRVAIFVPFLVATILCIPSVVADPTMTSSGHGGLFSRQIAAGFDPSKLPTSCIQTKCQDFVNEVTDKGCVTLDCLCTNEIVSAIKSCEQCAVDAKIGLNQTEVDDAMAEFAQSCSSAGHPISGISAGGSGNNSIASSLGSVSSVSSTGTVSASTGGNSSTFTFSAQSAISESNPASITSPISTLPSSDSGSESSSNSSGAAARMHISIVSTIFAAALGGMIFAV